MAKKRSFGKAQDEPYFDQVDTKVDFPKMENRILDYWYRKGIVKKYLQKNNTSKKTFSFLDGPITANNPMGVHHAWGRTYKDLWQRYKNMQGYKQRFQNGFDCQGLWVEVEVEKDLGFDSKKDIEKFGLDNFSEACTARVDKFSAIQTDQSKRLGQFMDWEDSYFTFTDKNIEYIWYFLKKCYEKGWLYKGYRSLPWCARCGTSLSQHELSDSYRKMTHKSVYLRFPLRGKKDEYFLVWTTTPWTLSANVALALNPDLTYVKVRTEGEVLILAKDLLRVLKSKYKILEKIKGKRLEGIKYQSPFGELPVQKETQKVVIMWEDVSDTEGTGVVHIAPGCGEEDFQLGKKNKLKVVVPLDENGVFTEGYGKLTGKFAHKAEDLIFESLKEKGLLYKVEDYTHSYPICWRCKEPIVFRAEENWFIGASEIRPKMIKETRKVKWYPGYVGKLMEDWLRNMGDWNISRKRYFGLPLPFYECDCGQLTIISSKKELKKLAVEKEKVVNLKELHRPWIDEILIKCPDCKQSVSRIKDVGDCWLDAGIVPFSTLKYLEDKNYWKQWFPADWISEMREQVRLWFYSMMFMSVTLESRTPYLEVLSYEKLFDEQGKPMHKSAGNAIWFEEAAEKMGADVMRWMYVKQDPSDNLLFGYKVADEVRRAFHLKLWNVYNFFVTYANVDGWRPNKSSRFKVQSPKLSILDRWILSRLNQTIKGVTDNLESYNAYNASRLIEGFVNDLSNWYVRRSRERVGPSADEGKDKEACYQTLYFVLVTLTALLAPFTPFLVDEIYKNLTKDLSVHLTEWPKVKQLTAGQKKLIKDMEVLREVVERAHSERKQKQIPVRQPLASLSVVSTQSKPNTLLLKLLMDEINVQEIKWKKGSKVAVKLDTKITPQLKEEARVRELIRRIQEERKKMGVDLTQKVKVVTPWIPKSKDLTQKIMKKTLTKELLTGKFKVMKAS